MNFKCLLKASLLIIVPVSFYSFLVALLENNQNQIITSLFLSLIYGSIYVIILYIVVSRLIIKQEKSANALQKSEKKKVIALIYEGRYAVRLVIILYVFVRGCRILMLGGYSAAAIAIPVLLGGILLGCGGIRGLVSFYQSIFWWVVSFLTVVTVGGISKVYPGRWGSLLEWHLEKPILRGICEIMKSGYIFLAAFAMIEFVVYLYTMVERRKRLMLGTAIALPVIISVMGSLFVIGILGI